MDIPEASLQYFVTKILAPVLRKPLRQFQDKAPEPFENFMLTLPVPSSKPSVTFSSGNDFVKYTEPCLVREAFRSVRDAALQHRAEATNTHNFRVAYGRSSKFVEFSLPGVRTIQLNMTSHMPEAEDGSWNIKLVLVQTGPRKHPKIQLGYIHRGFRDKRSPYRPFHLDLWLAEGLASGSLPSGEPGCISELTPFTSVYRQCWALSMFRQTVRSDAYLYRHFYTSSDIDERKLPLMDAFLSLPDNSYRSSQHNFGNQYKEILDNLNGMQKRVVQDFAYRVISTSPEDRKFVLGLQGPPGTGKSATIVALVKLLVKAKPGIKILVAGPSNAAVDSVGRRIAALQDALDAPILEKHEQDVYAWEERKQRWVALKEAKKKAIEAAGGTAPKADTTYPVPKPKTPKIIPTYDIIRLGYNKLIDEAMRKYMVGRRMPMLLKTGGSGPGVVEGNIFLSTLNSCASYMATKIHQLIKFDVVIVDEAGQALQLDTLIPVTILGVKKMILIGDQNQLSATVLDDQNIQVDFARSWLERLSMHFKNNISEMLPMLDVQYRMHPQICAFPSAEFYGGYLQTDPSVIGKSKDWKLQPLKFFDLADSKESQSGTSKYNDYEVKFIGELLQECLKQEHSQKSYAVITGYEAQRTRLIYYLKGIQLGRVRVSTVDGFQGQENEVIIVSCVRAGGHGIGFLKDRKRLNVALTRAQHSVFIVGHRGTLEGHIIWKNFFNQPKLGENVVTVPGKYKIGRIVMDHVLKPVVPLMDLNKLEEDLNKLSVAA